MDEELAPLLDRLAMDFKYMLTHAYKYYIIVTTDNKAGPQAAMEE